LRAKLSVMAVGKIIQISRGYLVCNTVINVTAEFPSFKKRHRWKMLVSPSLYSGKSKEMDEMTATAWPPQDNRSIR
jgi:hypothetical protein